MIRHSVFLAVLLPLTVNSFGQTTTSLQDNPSWTNNDHWSGTAPQYDMERSATLEHNSTVTNEIIVKSNYVLIIEAGVILSTNQAFTIKENATVIIRGTLRGTDGGKEFKIEGNATLIVQSGGSIDWAGKWTTNDEGVNITIDGTVHVEGDFNHKGTITGSGTLTVEGEVNNDGGSVFGCEEADDGCCTSSPCTMNTTLPVRLLDFSARAEDDAVVLSWTTISEENFSRFVVQHSADGLKFDDVGEVPGQGFNIYDIESKYSYEDRSPLIGLNYYRLKAIDIDDTHEYFGVLAVLLKDRKKIEVFPNPSAGDQISFRTNFNPGDSDRIILVDQLGVEILNRPTSTSQNRIGFQTRLSPGVYLLRYISKDFEGMTKVLIKH